MKTGLCYLSWKQKSRCSERKICYTNWTLIIFHPIRNNVTNEIKSYSYTATCISGLLLNCYNWVLFYHLTVYSRSGGEGSSIRWGAEGETGWTQCPHELQGHLTLLITHFIRLKVYNRTAFYAPGLKDPPWATTNQIVHLSCRPFVHNIPFHLHIKCSILSLGGDTVTKLGL